jgi:threonyl-tRNA synthetase
MLVIGEKEVKISNVSVRRRDDGDMGSMPIQQLLEVLHEEGI